LKPTKKVDCKQKGNWIPSNSQISSNSNYLQANSDLNNNVHDHDDELNIAPLATNNVRQKSRQHSRLGRGWKNGSTIVRLRWEHLGKTYAFNTCDTSKHIGF
jgi:hypothetical protein